MAKRETNRARRTSRIGLTIALGLGATAMSGDGAADTRGARSMTIEPMRLSLSGGGAMVQVRAFEGGTVRAPFEPGAPTTTPSPAARPDDVRVETSFEAPMIDWIGGTLARTAPRRSGVLEAAGRTLTFQDALLAQATFPALDVSSRSSPPLVIRFAPELVQWGKADKRPLAIEPRPVPWIASAFRLRIERLEGACDTVRRIEPFSVTQKVVTQSTGVLETHLVPASVSFSNLVVTLPTASAAAFEAWKNAPRTSGGGPRSGTLAYLSNGGDTRLSLRFENLSVVSMAPAPGPGRPQTTVVLSMGGLKVVR